MYHSTCYIFAWQSVRRKFWAIVSCVTQDDRIRRDVLARVSDGPQYLIHSFCYSCAGQSDWRDVLARVSDATQQNHTGRGPLCQEVARLCCFGPGWSDLAHQGGVFWGLCILSMKMMMMVTIWRVKICPCCNSVLVLTKQNKSTKKQQHSECY